MKKLILILIILMFGLTCAYGASGGSAVFDFLKLDTNARSAAIGGTFVGISDDVNTLAYNPAGLGNIDINQITFMHNQWFEGVRQQYIGFVHRKGFGVGINYVDYGKIQRTTIKEPKGTGLGKFSSYDMALLVGYGKRIRDTLSLGLNLKYIAEKIYEYNAWAMALDGGLLYRIPSTEIDVGLSLQNIGTNVEFRNKREELPQNVKLGLCYRFNNEKGLIAIDFNKQLNGIYSFNLGSEYSIIKCLTLRAGLNGRNKADSGLVAGLGITCSEFILDYAVSPYGELGLTHRISISKKFGR